MSKIELKEVCKKLYPEENDDRIPFSRFSALMAHLYIGKKAKEYFNEKNKSSSFSLKNINLLIPDGKTMVILGPSGCGKTTLLKLIAGLSRPDSGNIFYDDINMLGVPPKDRKIGIIFQDYALYPHFTSKRNIISYFFFKKKSPELDKEAREKFQKTSELMGVDIEYLLGRKPTNLSGGEKQRISLARCITREPKLFLMDEPFSNLDQKLREKYRFKLKMLLNHFKITSVYVTHDQKEAVILADVLAIMNHGIIEQVGTVESIYNNPKNIFIAEFLNLSDDVPAINIIDGAILSEELKSKKIGIRPEEIDFSLNKKDNFIPCSVKEFYHISVKRITVMCLLLHNENVYTTIPLNDKIKAEDQIWIKFKKYLIFDKTSGERIQGE